MKTRWLILCWLCAAAFLLWWWAGNPLPDGYQNEYLHVGNAYDLWGALLEADLWHLRWYMYTGYWPWGLHAVPWPFLAVLGPGRLGLLLGNLVHLGVLLWGARALGRAFGAPLAPLILLLCPAVFGSLVRYEPNLAAIAWTVAGLGALVGSSGLRSRAHLLGYGACLGLGLMMDRLTVGFFLLPALLPYLWYLRGPEGRRAALNLGLGLGLALLLTVAYYREFFLRHTGELLGQAPVGEIDAAGAVTSSGASVLYYVLVLVDSQAGPVIGMLMLWGLVVFLRDGLAELRRGWPWQPRAALLLAVILPWAFFTLVAKKQVYYTLPVLGPLAVMAASRGRLAWIGVVGGLWAFGVGGLGLLPGERLAFNWMPELLVEPRHLLARPPSGEDWPLDEAIAALPTAPGNLAVQRAAPPGSHGPSIAVLSEDDRLFEGFVILAIREGLPGAWARGVVLDPVGTAEMFDHTQALLWVGPAGEGWPSERDIQSELLADHYALHELPPVWEVVAEAEEQFVEKGRWNAGDVDIVVFERTRWPAVDGAP